MIDWIGLQWGPCFGSCVELPLWGHQPNDLHIISDVLVLGRNQSPTLTALMLAVVPPVSLGAVRLENSRMILLSCASVFSVFQVVYGRYLKTLSNRTQEAIGDMTKASADDGLVDKCY